jgi:anti-sigma regulatory factor (Ser/Thr protein kinase)
VKAELVLRSHPTELHRARSFVREVLADHGFGDKESYDGTLAVNEALANAIEHGEPCAGGNVHLEADIEDDQVVFYVRDCGRFVLGPREPQSDRGRGIPLMNLLTDEVRMDASDKGTTVRLALRIAA